jgi:hypothetical protein
MTTPDHSAKRLSAEELPTVPYESTEAPKHLPAHLERIASRDYCGVNEGFWILRDAAAYIASLESGLSERDALIGEDAWRPIETAPKGGGAELVKDPAWVEPPKLLLLFEEDQRAVGVWDWYYAEGGHGYRDDVSAWLEPISGEQIALYYGEPTHWRPLPAPPAKLTGQPNG